MRDLKPQAKRSSSEALGLSEHILFKTTVSKLKISQIKLFFNYSYFFSQLFVFFQFI